MRGCVLEERGCTGGERVYFQDLDQEVPDTTLLIHFFGPKGTQVLNYNDFHK